MECQEFKMQTPMLLDGALGPSEEAEMIAHLEGCELCARRFDEEQRYHSFLRKRLAPAPAPTDLRRQIMADMRATRPLRRWQIPAIFTSVAAAAAVAALVLTGIDFGGTQVPGAIKTAIARQSDDRLPLDVKSADEADLQHFFANHLPFDLSLPRISGESKVRGGRLTYLGEQPSAMISYEIDGAPASLYIFTDPKSAEFASEKEHHCSLVKEGHNHRQAVIWHRGKVVYSLVGQQSEAFMNDFMKKDCAP